MWIQLSELECRGFGRNLALLEPREDSNVGATSPHVELRVVKCTNLSLGLMEVTHRGDVATSTKMTHGEGMLTEVTH